MLFTLCLSAKIGRQTFVFLESLIFWERNSYITYQIVTLQIQRSTLKTCRESFECLEFDYFQRTELKNIRALVFYTCILQPFNPILNLYIFEGLQRIFKIPKNLRLRSIFQIRRFFVFVFGPFSIFIATLTQ